MRKLTAVTLIVAFIATLAPFVHVLEMISKLTLDGPLWLSIQQNLYRGWGPALGPFIVLALLLSLTHIVLRYEPRHAFIQAALCYAAMLVCFFVFNDPVNKALTGRTAATLPPEWSSYRLRWEMGHFISAVFSALGFVALLRPQLKRGQ